MLCFSYSVCYVGHGHHHRESRRSDRHPVGGDTGEQNRFRKFADFRSLIALDLVESFNSFSIVGWELWQYE